MAPLLPETFLESFVLPLVAGGELHVGRPVDGEDLTALRAELVTTTEQSLQVELARQREALALWLYPVATPLTGDELQLSAGAHNLLFLGHPGAARWYLSDASLERVRHFTQHCFKRPPEPRRGAELVARHTLLGPLLRLQRTDVEVRFWAGKRTFLGQEPPARLLRWRSVRGVHEERQQVRWLESELTPAQQELLPLLLRQSPLTDLLSPLRPAPAFEWAPLASWLARRDVARLVCQHYLELGLERVGPPLSRAFWRLVDHGPLDGTDHSATVRLVADLLVYLHAAAALTAGEANPPAADADQPELSLTAVLTALHHLGQLPSADQLSDTRVSECFARWTTLLEQQLGGEQLAQLTRRLQRALAH